MRGRSDRYDCDNYISYRILELFVSQLEEKEVCCSCKCAKNKNNKESLAKLSSASETASLLYILGDRILLSLNGLLELTNPLNISLVDVIALTDSLGLVCETVTKVSVLNKLRKNLVTVGSESRIVESVDILGNAVGSNTEFLTAELIELKEVIQEFFINFSAHDFKPHLKKYFFTNILYYIFFDFAILF